MNPPLAIALLIVLAVPAWAQDRKMITVTEEARKIHSENTVVDGHNDLPWMLRKTGGRFDKSDIAKPQPNFHTDIKRCLLYTSPSPRDQRGSRMPSSA